MRGHEQIAARAGHYARGIRARSYILCVTAIAIAITLAAGTPAAPQRPVRTEMAGGPGGSLYEHVCGPGRVLVGVQGYAGVLLDNVQAVCARVDADGLSDAKPEGPVFGGNRPINGSAKCPGDAAVKMAFVQDNEKDPYVGLIELYCQGERQPVERQPVTLRGTGHLRGYSEPNFRHPSQQFKEGKYLECQGESVAVGISVRAGKFLDAFGLICGPRPKILNKRKKKPEGTTLEEGRDKTSTSLPDNPEAPAPSPTPTPAPSPAPGSHSPAPSTNVNLPTPLKSNELQGDMRAGTPPQFYSFTAGPGEVVFTLDVSGAAPGGGMAYIYLIKPDAPDTFLDTVYHFGSAGASDSLVKRVQFAERQTIILRVGGHIGGGSFRLRISGAATFN